MFGITCVTTMSLYNAPHDKGYPSIGCEPCTRAVQAGEDVQVVGGGKTQNLKSVDYMVDGKRSA